MKKVRHRKKGIGGMGKDEFRVASAASPNEISIGGTERRSSRHSLPPVTFGFRKITALSLLDGRIICYTKHPTQVWFGADIVWKYNLDK
jgi:hypothetical protein